MKRSQPPERETNMIKVHGIKPHHAGFGQFQKDEGQEYPQFDSAEEYAQNVVQQNKLVYSYAIDADDAQMGDEDGERMAEAIRNATGSVQGGHGTIIAFTIGDEIHLESVEVIA